MKISNANMLIFHVGLKNIFKEIVLFLETI